MLGFTRGRESPWPLGPVEAFNLAIPFIVPLLLLFCSSSRLVANMGLCSSSETYDTGNGETSMTAEEESVMRKKVARRGRRVSVSAESGEDADADFVPPKIPKSEAQSERIAAVVRKVFLFQGLSTTELNTIIGAMSEKTVGKGVELIKQGGVGDFFYVVDKGAFDVFVKGVNNDKPVFDYHEGGSFGELAVSKKPNLRREEFHASI